MFGYKSKQYAKAMSNLGELVYFPSTNAHLLKINQPGGMYELKSLAPFFSPLVFNSAAFNMDVGEVLDKQCTRIVIETDPLQNLGHINNIGFKQEEYQTHCIVNLQAELQMAHKHWDNVRTTAREGYEVAIKILNPTVNLVDYAKHFRDLVGSYKLPENCIVDQFRVPGIVVFESKIDNNLPVAIVIFYVQDKTAYLHLTGGDKKYQYAIIYQAILFFKSLGLTYLVLGSSGEFNKGFSNMELKSYRLTKEF